ncbi:MAG TPA: helix-turn-helix domain-containing protein [Candidatus Mediterraneibacter avicola]|nr:helix-turn-helix domain-containing protein [Candidatus Mediterraneibacter avicola]
MDNRVKELRNEKGLRQEDLAGKINVSQQTVSRIENGENSLPADLLIHLSKFFHVSADYILKLSDVRMTQEYRIDVERSLERNMNFCNAFERLSRTNQELVIRLMEQLDDSQNVKNEKE